MADAKEVFLKDKALAAKWSAWTQGHDGMKVFATADGELSSVDGLNGDMIRGARIYRNILKTLADEEEEMPDLPKSGLDHSFDPQPRTVKKKK